MKIKLLILTAVFILNFQIVFAQTEKQISAIRREVAAVERNLKSYKKTVESVEGISLEGTEAAYYVSGRGLQKIHARIYGETFNAAADFYYQGEELIFAFYKINRYDTQIGLKKPPKVVRSEERRFYFAGGNLIRLLDGKREITGKDEKYETMKDEIFDVADKLKNAFNTP